MIGAHELRQLPGVLVAGLQLGRGDGLLQAAPVQRGLKLERAGLGEVRCHVHLIRHTGTMDCFSLCLILQHAEKRLNKSHAGLDYALPSHNWPTWLPRSSLEGPLQVEAQALS